MPIGVYNGSNFASTLQDLTGRSWHYNPNTNALTVNDPNILTDDQMVALGVSTPNSITSILSYGDQIIAANFPSLPSTSIQNGSTITFPFLNLQCYDAVYLRSHALACPQARGACKQPHDIILKIPLLTGCGEITKAETSVALFQELPNRLSLNTLDFRLTDVAGNPVNLRGLPLSFQITFDQ